MEVLDKLRKTVRGAKSAGRSRIEDLRDGQRRKGLLVELGELTYRQRSGEDIPESAYTPVVTELNSLSSRRGGDDEDDSGS